MKVKMGRLTKGEFWVALSNEPKPENNMMIIALQSENGEIRTYVDQADSFSGRFTWAQVAEGANYGNGPTYTYDIMLSTSASTVDSRINFFDLPSQIVNLPKYLFIGFRNKSTIGSVSISITVSELTIEVSQ